MSKELPKDSREWAHDTTDRQGRERDLEDYEGWLGFKREDLEGKSVLDIGSGERELFSKDLRGLDISAKVFTLNPDYSDGRYRKRIKLKEDWQKKSTAGIAQELPYQDNTFDIIVGLYSVTAFSAPDKEFGNPEAAKKWLSEVARVLKSGGKAIFAPVTEGEGYEELLKELEEKGYIIKVENIKNKDLGLTKEELRHYNPKTGTFNTQIQDYPENSWAKRLIIIKP